MTAHLFSFFLFTLLLYIHEAELLPAGQNGTVDEASKDRAPPKSNFECEYKCASHEHVCELDKSRNGGEKCTEECGKWQQICREDGHCRKQCAFTTQNCVQQKGDMVVAAVTGKLCIRKCIRWDVVCAVPDDLSPIISRMDDGAGGKNPFEPAKCLRTCGKWDSLSRCIKWICNSLPQVAAEDANGKKTENVLAEVECIGSCVIWNKFGTCVQWKCFKMESKDAFKIASMQRNWWDDFWGKVKEWGPTAISICSLLGVCG